jgi:hypothetical protein
MRDNHEGMPELLAAYERDGEFYGVAAVMLNSECRQFEFWLPGKAYIALRRILQTRPFDPLSMVQYHYFVADAYGRSPDSDIANISIRIEQGSTGRQFPFKVPVSLASSLLFFSKLKNFSNAAHLQSPNLFGTNI